MTNSFCVFINGVTNGSDEEIVAEQLAKLMRLNQEQALALLRNGKQQVKAGISKEVAQRYKTALEPTGAQVIIIDAANESPASTGKNELSQPSPVVVDHNLNNETTSTNPPSGINKTDEKHSAESSGARVLFGATLAPLLLHKQKTAAIAFACCLTLVLIYAYPHAATYYKKYKQEKLIDKIASIRPATLDLIANETRELTLPDVMVRWDTVPPVNSKIDQMLKALREKDDVTLSSGDYDFLLPYNELHGSGTPPDEDEDKLYEELDSLEGSIPALSIEIARYHHRTKNLDAAYSWYQRGIAKGLKVAQDEYVKLAEQEHEYDRLVRLFSGLLTPNEPNVVRDFGKVAQYFPLLAKNQPQILKDKALMNTVLGNGPRISSRAYQLVIDTIAVSSGDTWSCNALNTDPAEPDATDTDTKKRGGLPECIALAKANIDSAKHWYRLGYALQREGEWNKAKISYAKAAELGSAIGIAQYWYVDAFSNKDRALKMLEIESTSGNPYGDYFAGRYALFADGSDKNIPKAKELLNKALLAGIYYAAVDLADIAIKENEPVQAQSYLEKVADYYPSVSRRIAESLINGELAKDNYDSARLWFVKAADQGNLESKTFLSRLGSSKDENIVGSWKCKYGDAESSAFFSIDGKGFYNVKAKTAMTVGQKYEIANSVLTFSGQAYLGSGEISNDGESKWLGIKHSGPNNFTAHKVTLGSKELNIEVNCQRTSETVQPLVKLVPANRGRGGFGATYAETVASSIESIGHPACRAMAYSIRMIGNSRLPENAKESKIDSMIDKMPAFCIPPEFAN
jgi:TPR repeat protein